MRRIKSRKNRAGFTLVELMLALAFFSFILIFVLGAFLLITRNYNRGVTSSRVHQAGRNTMEQMVRDIRQSQEKPIFYRVGPAEAYICYSDGTYQAIDDINVADGGLLQRTDQDLLVACADGTVSSQFNTSAAQEVLDQDQVVVVNVNLNEIEDSLYRLELALASANIVDAELGTDTTGDGENDTCSVATNGSEFCDVVTLSTLFGIR